MRITFNKRVFRSILHAFLLLLLWSCSSSRLPTLKYGTAQEVGMDADTLACAVDLYRQAVEKDELRGVVVLVARLGVVVVHEAIGWRDKENELPMQKDSLFRMASNTKPTISTAVLILAEEGKLALGDRAGKYLAAFAEGSSAGITIHHLLTHTSGLRIGSIFLSPLLEKSPQHPDAPSLQVEVTRFGEIGPEEEPGTTYSYSNPGFNTLGAIIEVVSGQPLDMFLKEQLYDPLGMHDSLNHESQSDHSRMSKVYSRRRGEGEWYARWSPGDSPDYPFVRASGGMISTVWDYAIFCQMYLNGGVYNRVRILSPESVELATFQQTREIPLPEGQESRQSFYGYGWNVSPEGAYSHGGSDGTYAWVDPDLQLIGLVFTQSPGGENPLSGFRDLVAASVSEPGQGTR